MRYTDLIFDLYGTLVDIRTDEDETTWAKTAVYFGFYGAHYTGDELKAAFQRIMTQRQASAGQNYECFPDIPCESVFAQLFQEKGICEEAEELGFHAAQLFRISSMRYIRLYPGVMEALKQLREHGYRLWLLSNAQRSFTAYELRHLQLDDKFDRIYISSDFGCRKPDLRFFQALLQENNLDPNTCLMIGNDRITDIGGAKQAGLDTFYLHANITPADQAKADLTLLPGVAPANTHHFEFEGTDWHQILPLLLQL